MNDRKEYMFFWRAKNKDKLKKYYNNYKNKHPNKNIERREYFAEWRKNNKDKISIINKTYKQNHPEIIKAKNRNRKKTAHRLAWTREYIKKRLQIPEEKKKHYIRTRTLKKYGKTPKGYQKHHLDYDSPDNFIVMPIHNHKLIHQLILAESQILEGEKNGNQ